MKRRTFLASLIGLCLAPLAKARAAITGKSSQGIPDNTLRVYVGDRMMYCYKSPEGKPLTLMEPPSLTDFGDWWKNHRVDGKQLHPDTPTIKILRLEWMER